jgi:molybdate transport system ATP-binding protein
VTKKDHLVIELDIRKRLIGSKGPFDLNVQLRVPTHELAVLYGASGAGKTTLLRMLAGLDRPTEGRIVVDGETWYDSSRNLCVPPQKRSIGFVFQNYALFPSMTVRGNLEFAAPRRNDPQTDMLLKLTEMVELQHRYPGELSGGQQQRVALARALMRRPKLLLLDEPLSALDIDMREKLQHEIAALHRDLKLTTILVSHDRAEISRVADRVCMIRDGSVTFDGNPSDAFQENTSASGGRVQGHVVDIVRSNGSVAIRAAVPGDTMQVEIHLNERQVRELIARRGISANNPD